MRTCTKCGESKPTSQFYKGSGRGGLKSRCKACTRAAIYARRAADPEKARAATRSYAANHREELKEYARQWRLANPAYGSEQYQRTRARRRAQGTAYRQRHPEKHRARQKARRARRAGVPYESVDFATVLAAHGPTCWLCNNPIDLSLDRQRHAMALTFDHVVPLSRGGAHAESNLRPAHRSCNSSRGNRDQKAQRIEAERLL